MKSFLQIFFIAFFTTIAFAQQPLNLSQGETLQKDYLTTLPYKEIKEKIIVEAVINGKTYNFLLDTGAPMIISKKLFKELNLPATTKLEITDQSSKKDTMNVFILPNIKIGNVDFNNIPTLISEESIVDCLGIDGFIGSNVLRNSIIQFSSKNKTITITDNPKSLNLKSKNASKLFLNAQSNPYIWIEQKNGKITGREQLLFDTGMDEFYDLSIHIYKKHFEKIKLFDEISKSSGTYSMGIHGSAKIDENYKFLLPNLSINNVDFKNVVAKTTYDKSSRIGATLLKYGIVTIDYKNKKFYFEAFDNAKTFDIAEKQWPFNAILDDEKLKIGIIWDSTLTANMKPGDLIMKFNDTDYQNKSKCDLVRANFKSIDVETATITLKDWETGEIKNLEIKKSAQTVSQGRD